jgi:hypothetical protein
MIVSDERKNLMRQLEYIKSEADWRSIGGFQSTDTKFAREVSELLRELLVFIDGHEDEMTEREHEAERIVQEAENELEWANKKLDKIHAYIDERKQLRAIEAILSGGHDDDY